MLLLQGLSSQLSLFLQVKSRGSDGESQPGSGCLSGSRQPRQPLPCRSNPRTRAPLRLICLRPREIVKCFWLISYARIIRWQQLPSGFLALVPTSRPWARSWGERGREASPQPCSSSVSLPESRLEARSRERSPVEGQRCSVKSDNRQVAEGVELWWCFCQLMGWHGIAGWLGCHEHGR